jgi:hypothetical protein
MLSLETIGPDKAAEYLGKNHGNRPLRDRLIKRYAKVMQADNWMLSPDCIAFAEDGRLLNGQHRLNALIRSETTQKFAVMRGLKAEVFKVMDAGQMRTVSDTLAVEGYKYHSRMAALVRLCLSHEESALKQRPHFENAECLAYARKHDDSLITAIDQTTQYEDDLKGLLRPRHLYLAYWLYVQRDADKTEEAIKRLATTVGITSEKSPIKLLRDRLLKEAMGPDKLNPVPERALLIRAMNHFFEGRELTVLRWSPGQGQNFPEPRITE